jgi:hypothetical protein
MKLTEKDKRFLETLTELMASKDLWVELRPDEPSRMVLKGTYGESVHRAFRMSRQGVRWRFWRLFNDIYVSAFETILFIEKVFGTQLREHAIRISRERYDLRQRALRCFRSGDELLRESQSKRPGQS